MLSLYCFSNIHSIAEKCEVVRDGRTGSLIFVGQLLVGNRKKAGFYRISNTANGGVDLSGLNSGLNSSASSKPCSCGAGITVIRCSYVAVRLRRPRHFRNMNFMSSHEKASGKIKITIVKKSVP